MKILLSLCLLWSLVCLAVTIDAVSLYLFPNAHEKFSSHCTTEPLLKDCIYHTCSFAWSEKFGSVALLSEFHCRRNEFAFTHFLHYIFFIFHTVCSLIKLATRQFSVICLCPIYSKTKAQLFPADHQRPIPDDRLMITERHYFTYIHSTVIRVIAFTINAV